MTWSAKPPPQRAETCSWFVEQKTNVIVGKVTPTLEVPDAGSIGRLGTTRETGIQ